MSENLPAQSDQARHTTVEIVSEDSANKIYARVKYATKVFLMAFSVFVVLKVIAVPLWGPPELIRSTFANYSMITSVFMLVYLAGFYLLLRGVGPESKLFYPLIILSAAVIYAAILYHLHLAGSLSSINPLLVVTYLMVLSWLFPKRATVHIFAIAHACLFGMIGLEMAGVLDYAPLLQHSEQLAAIYLDWHSVLMNLAIYATAALLLVVILTRFRENQERANTALRQEIQVRKKAETQKEESIARLQEALTQVKTLHGLLPICASCRKVRDDQGYWSQLESYLEAHADMAFTHGLCPNCVVELYGEIPPKVVRRDSEK